MIPTLSNAAVQNSLRYFLLFLNFYIPAAIAMPKLLISGYMANPTGTDNHDEYVQLRALETVDFSSTPYSVIFLNNGTASSNGWAAGGILTYGFSITSGILNPGDIAYVGGSGKLINGNGSTDISSALWLRTIDTATSAGDHFGNADSAGVLGNGGVNANGIAIFELAIDDITASSVPIDAVFFGTGIGASQPSTGGYTVPSNDHYDTTQGTFGHGSNTYLFPNPTTGAFTQLAGHYNLPTATWISARSSSVIPLSSNVPLTASLQHC